MNLLKIPILVRWEDRYLLFIIVNMANNDNTNYTFSDRFQRFIQKIANFAQNARSKNQIDSGPQDIFTGEQGELLTKYKNKIFYRKNEGEEFVSLSDEYSELTNQYEYLLSKGVNKYATWQKTSKTDEKDWTFTGYFSPICGIDCCALSGSVTSGSV